MTVAPYPRDLAGYTGRPPAWKLPGGARVAVSLVVNFEEGAELSAGDGDPASERLGEIVSIIPAGKWDQGTEQVFAYGMRAGIWRFLDWLDRHGRKITFYMCGRAIERSPEIARRIVEAGHEPACHGWLWQPQSSFDSEAAERAGFGFHTVDGERYWDERGYYAFTLEQIERDIEAPTAELDGMCRRLVERAIDDEQILKRL